MRRGNVTGLNFSQARGRNPRQQVSRTRGRTASSSLARGYEIVEVFEEQESAAKKRPACEAMISRRGAPRGVIL
jgi:hypothetical protein